MGIKVDVLELQRKSTLAASLAIQLNNKVSEINSIYYSLDSKVKSRESIEYSLRNLHQRMQKAQQRMDAMGRFLSVAANKYNNAESVVRARAAALGQVSVGSAVGAGTTSGVVRVIGTSKIAELEYNTGAVQGKSEGKKWYQKNWVKIAVGAAVVATAVAFAVTVGGPILIGAAVGATIGAGVGGVIGGVTSKKSGGNFIDGFADGFVWGAIGGAASGAVGATSLGALGAAGAEGTINSAIYAGQTHENGGHITAAGIATSFAVGAAFSAVGSVASKKISKVVSGRIKNINTSEVKSKIKILSAKDAGLKPVNNGVNNPELSRIDYLRNKYGKLTSEQINNRINLRGATHEELARLKESGLTKTELGPAVAGVLDTKTGKYYFGINNIDGKAPSIQHDLIREGINNMPADIRDGYKKTLGVGSHAEVNALNEALLARQNASLDEFMVQVISARKINKYMPAGVPMPRCPHCEFITDGANYFPEVLKYGK